MIARWTIYSMVERMCLVLRLYVNKFGETENVQQ